MHARATSGPSPSREAGHRFDLARGGVVGIGAARPIAQQAGAQNRGGGLRILAHRDRDLAAGAQKLAFEQEGLARFERHGEARQLGARAFGPFGERGERPALGRIVAKQPAQQIVHFGRRIVLAGQRVPAAELHPLFQNLFFGQIGQRPFAAQQRQHRDAQREQIVARTAQPLAVGIADRHFQRFAQGGLQHAGGADGRGPQRQARFAVIVPKHVVGADRAMRHAAPVIFGQHLGDRDHEHAREQARIQRFDPLALAQQRRPGRRFVDHGETLRAVGPGDGPRLQQLHHARMFVGADLRASAHARQLLGARDQRHARRIGARRIAGGEGFGQRACHIQHGLGRVDLDPLAQRHGFASAQGGA
jgi:hypothetical protein